MALPVTVVRFGINKECYDRNSKYFISTAINELIKKTKVRNSTYVYLKGAKPFVPPRCNHKIQSFILFAVDRVQLEEMRNEAALYTPNIEGHLYCSPIDKEEEEEWWKASNGSQLYFLSHECFSYMDCILFSMAEIHKDYWWYRKNAEWQKANPITQFRRAIPLKRKAEESIVSAPESVPAKKKVNCV